MRLAIRLILLSLHVLLGLLLTLLLAGVLRWDSQHPRYKATTGWWLRQVCTILGIQIRVHGQQAEAPAMFVSNHTSWLDIPVLASQLNPRFLSKAEVGQWPLIGSLAKYSGTLFIQRGGSTSASNAIEQLTECLENSQNVLVFPEGTTTDGKDVRRFHARLLKAAVTTHSKVQPIALRYTGLDGQYDPDVAFVGEQTMLDNALRVLSKKGLIADIQLLPPLTDVSQTRSEKAKLAEAMVGSVIRSQ